MKKRRRLKSKEIEARVIKEAEFIIKSELTLREAANTLFVSKSTLHMDLYKKVKAILDRHNIERYHNGGIAAANKRITRKKNSGKY